MIVRMFIKLCLLMALFSFNGCDDGKVSSSVPSTPAQHLTMSSTIHDVLNHPAFKGFSQYILPLEWGYDSEMPLSQVARLLPYHNYIDAERCVGYINQMIDSVAAGRRIYYDLGREDAGLFFSADERARRLPSSVPGWIFVCGFHPRGFPTCTGVEPDGIQCLCNPIPDWQRTDSL